MSVLFDEGFERGAAAFLKLGCVRSETMELYLFESRGHFFAAAAEAMRRILIDRARQKLAAKRGARPQCVNLDDLAVDEAMSKLAEEDTSSAEFIKLRFFAGHTNSEAAQALGIPERTARRRWSFARAWLFREIQKQMA